MAGKLSEEHAALAKLVNDAKGDVEKAEGGNKAAGTRVRKTMQDVKAKAQELRVAVLGGDAEPKTEPKSE